MTENPIIMNSGGDRVLIKGTFLGRVTSMSLVDRKKFQSEELEPNIRFIIDIDAPHGDETVFYHVRPVWGERSKIYGLLSALFPNEVRLDMDKDEVWQLCNESIDKKALFVIENDKQGKYNNVVSVVALPSSNTAKKVIKKTESPKQEEVIDFDDTDIPF